MSRSVLNTLIIAFLFLLTTCTTALVEPKKGNSRSVELTMADLLETIEKLQNEQVSGYVVISYLANEYSSIEMAREDTSPPLSLVAFDTDRLDYHTPKKIGDDRFHHFGSSLICRKVIADHGDVLEVKTLDPDQDLEKLGHGGLGADYLYELNTIIRKIDLVPVLNSIYDVVYKDGSGIRFEPGVAVGIPWNTSETNRAASIQQMHFGFNIPDSLLALSYDPIMHISELSGDRQMLDEEADLFLNDQFFCKVNELRSDRMRTPVSIIKGRNNLLVELAENGISFKLTTKSTLVDPYNPDIARPILTNRYKNTPKWYYRLFEGTPIYWEDGRLAGRMRQYLGQYSNTGPEDSTYCQIMPEHFREMPICFKLEDIEVQKNH